MKILLDTHIFVWALNGDRRLKDKGRQLILDEKNQVYYSIISLWEIALKQSIHPKEFHYTIEQMVDYARQAGYHLLELGLDHILTYEKEKPNQKGIHKDPFDHMIFIQAKSANAKLLTHDKKMIQYEEAHIIGI